jgi:hypothetical protein
MVRTKRTIQYSNSIGQKTGTSKILKNVRVNATTNAFVNAYLHKYKQSPVMTQKRILTEK